MNEDSTYTKREHRIEDSTNIKENTGLRTLQSTYTKGEHRIEDSIYTKGEHRIEDSTHTIGEHRIEDSIKNVGLRTIFKEKTGPRTILKKNTELMTNQRIEYFVD